ncbi:MAG: fasciclin domain-containing protein [Planctomycetaceae bacterium]|jgi:transforming growth factor-beta-induced protein|nr:fasciclin domain-containing protein [Phycisphaerales bacterium]MCE2654076.1 fasciclin domain-containing protein [Planctomycetaceae bacterium]
MIRRHRGFSVFALVSSLTVGVTAAAGLMTLRTGTLLANAGTSEAGPAGQAAGGNIVQVAQQAGSFTTLLAAAQAAGLADDLTGPGPFTVFAPTDEAFAALGKRTIDDLLKPENRDRLTDILKFHVVPGRVTAAEAFNLRSAPTLGGQRLEVRTSSGQLLVDHVEVVANDIPATNGVIHVVGKVLTPETRSIVELARANSGSTLVKAVQAAGLAETLTTGGPFTILMPTDAAFAALPKPVLTALLKPENRDQLASILKLHVLSGRAYADTALAAGSAPTLNGQSVSFAIQNGRLTANNANVIARDVEAANAVIHVIDRVLLPEGFSPGSLQMAGWAAGDDSARAVIERAIAQGVPLFNNGNPEACATLYDLAARSIITADQTPSSVSKALRTARTQAAEQTDPVERAWVLRRGLDQALAMLPADDSINAAQRSNTMAR